MHQQRKALRAGELEERRKTLLDAPEAGMIQEPGEEAWETKLAALRSCRRTTGHLAPASSPRGAKTTRWSPSDSTWPTSAGKAASAKYPKRAATRAQQLKEIDPDPEREGTDQPVPRSHTETIAVDSETEPVTVKLGVWISNTKARRDKLTQEQLDMLRGLGVTGRNRWPHVRPGTAEARPRGSEPGTGLRINLTRPAGELRGQPARRTT
ncbi:hypothetical protein GCM10010289_80960 [Streptomyces violascens]|uniref:Helicase-associated domain-containing protein n=1 Tax=Streptomyces violascens TaxID=67381 RepID=A0ABQ3QS86_9ACTN|nr:hypothetical protein GCM10010289_80960 [Streptomyces violascens]GHI40123.1 hypothetical protein Sviol_45310 [Streptomyces violascens]